MDFTLPDSVKIEEEKDTLGGGGGVIESSIVKATIEMVYNDTASSGAKSIVIVAKTDEGNTIRQTTFISNKAGGYTYTNDKGTYPLPGFSQMSHALEAITGKPLGNTQDIQEKTIKLYDFDLKKEVPVKRQVFMDTLGKVVKIGVLKVSEEKATKESNYKDGTGEFREYNSFDKWFDAETDMTVLEQKDDSITEPKFMAKWLEKNEGKVKVIKAKNPGVASGAVSGAPATTTSTLFPTA
jgi:hypothetical protein